MYGAGQCNHILIKKLAQTGFLCTFVQPKATHHLVEERRSLGIAQTWIAEDDIYMPGGDHPSLHDETEPEQIFRSIMPDLIIFSDGCPVSNLAAKQVAIRLGIPYLVIVHCVTPSWARQFTKYLEALHRAYQKATEVIAVSHENLSLLHELFHLPPHLGQVIHNGVPKKFFSPLDFSIREKVRQEIGVPKDGILCLTVGRMESVKGYQYQMKAIARLRQSIVWPNLYFAWVGAGILEPRLRAWASQLNVATHIKFLGERQDIADVLNAADMFILPSHFEGMPLAIAEAMAKGLPVAASGISGVPEQLGNTGYLLPDPNTDPEILISQLIQIIHDWAEHTNVRRRIGMGCQQRAEEMFTVNSMFKKYLEHINCVLDKNQGAPSARSK